MARKAKTKSGRRAKPLYHSAKISDYQFKKVLWHFTLDHSAAEAAKHIKLSANSISAIYAKLRKFFFDYGLFNDPYKGGDPREGTGNADEERYEFNLLDFHLKRVAAKHGALDSPMDEPDYHFAESYWRYDYERLKRERGADLIHHMMLGDLMAFVRRFGPVGMRRQPDAQERRDGLALSASQFDQQLRWLERNAQRFRGEAIRLELRTLREDNE